MFGPQAGPRSVFDEDSDAFCVSCWRGFEEDPNMHLNGKAVLFVANVLTGPMWVKWHNKLQFKNNIIEFIKHLFNVLFIQLKKNYIEDNNGSLCQCHVLKHDNVDHNDELLTYSRDIAFTRKYFTSLKPRYLLLPPNEEASCSSSRCLAGLDRIYFAPESQQLAGNSPQLLPGATLTSFNSCLGNSGSTKEQFRCSAALCCLSNQTATVIHNWPFSLEMDRRHHKFMPTVNWLNYLFTL